MHRSLSLYNTYTSLHLRCERWWEASGASQLPSKLTSGRPSHPSARFSFILLFCAVHFRITSQNPRLTLVTKNQCRAKKKNSEKVLNKWMIYIVKVSVCLWSSLTCFRGQTFVIRWGSSFLRPSEHRLAVLKTKRKGLWNSHNAWGRLSEPPRSQYSTSYWWQ